MINLFLRRTLVWLVLLAAAKTAVNTQKGEPKAPGLAASFTRTCFAPAVINDPKGVVKIYK